MNFFLYIRIGAIFFVSLSLVYFVIPLFIKLAHYLGIYDFPNNRKIHTKKIPLLGGGGLYIGVLLSVCLHTDIDRFLLVILGGSSMIFFLGLLDDIRPIPAAYKLLGQGIVATWTWYMGIAITFVSNPIHGDPFFLNSLSGPITILWIVTVINTINLIDGIDGLASGIAAVSAFFLLLLGCVTGQWLAVIVATAIIGSCIGFLAYNFYPAKIFMGDSGAMLLGYLLSIMSIIGVFKSSLTVSLLIPVLILGLPLSDTLFTIIRRIKGKKAVFFPDRQHIHHQLIQAGIPPREVTLWLYGVSIIFGIMGTGLSFLSGTGCILLGGVLLIIIGVTFWLFKRRYKSDSVIKKAGNTL